jgi:hypothetical protein
MTDPNYNEHRSWDQPPYSIHHNLHLDPGQRHPSLFSNSSLQSTQNFQFPYPNDALSSEQTLQNANQRLFYGRAPRNSVGLQLEDFGGPTSTDHQNIYDHHSSLNQTNNFSPDIPYITTQPYLHDSTLPYGQEYDGLAPPSSGVDGATLTDGTGGPFSSSPSAIHAPFSQGTSQSQEQHPFPQTYFQRPSQVDPSNHAYSAKRQRAADEVDELKDDGAEMEAPAESSTQKVKP